ncbi:unnamed protein product [Linum tenue]|uniref:Uncharacterized protein n=1 Tax=Linum tenue TaxID=586396 RepID=A0AAV0RTR7_9ROSI|nr:unnamed protein product [Linum tenue]
MQSSSSMGEIDTKPIKSVQVALTLFEEKGDNQKKFAPTWSMNSSTHSTLDQAVEKAKDMDGLSKELSNCKLQLEAKDSEQLQLLRRVEHYQSTVEQLTSLLKDSESEKEFHIQQNLEAALRLSELGDQVAEAAKLREQLSNVLHELKYNQGEMLRIQAELATLKDEKNKALARAKAMESMANSDKGRSEELLKQVGDAQVEMTLLKSELIKIRSKAVVAEAVEARNKKQGGVGSVKRSTTHNVQGIVEEASQGNHSTHDVNCEGGGAGGGGKVMISLVDYEALVERASTANQSFWKDYDQSAVEFRTELGNLKKELEGALSKIGDFRARAEQAVTRADVAEKAKVEVEEELRKLRERKQKRKAALAALREESLSGKFSFLPTTTTSTYAPNKSANSYQPLGKILNLTY